MTHKEAFLQTYAQELQLPDRLRESFQVSRCLCRREDHALWLLQRRIDGQEFVLQTGDDPRQAEGQFAQLVRASRALPGAVPWAVDCFQEHGTSYLLRTWLPGQNLVQWRTARGRCSDRECARIGVELCRILQTLHDLEPMLIHRDVKPENILLDDQGTVRLLDFGIARTYRSGAPHDTSFMGTEATAAPEQYGYAQTDPRTDVYGLGMTLLYLRTGGYDREDLRTAAPWLRKALCRATDFSPDRRFPSASAFAASLTRQGPPSWVRRSLAAVLVLGLLAALAVQQQTLQRTRSQMDGAMDRLLVLEQQEQRRSSTVSFSSQVLEAAVRQELEKPRGEITCGDLELVRRLAVSGQTVFSREQTYLYQGCASVDDVVLDQKDKGDLRDLSLLAQMPNLKELYVCDQQITDLRPLEGLPLEVVYLGGNPITDFSPLASLPRLSVLNLDTGAGPMAVGSLSCLEQLPLRVLHLGNLEPEGGWAFLGGLQQLEQLSLLGVPEEALAPLAQLPTLWDLTLTDYPAADLRPLHLERLDTLTVIRGLKDCSGVEQLPHLKTFSLIHCPLTDLGPLEALPELFSINLDGMNLDFTQLNRLPGLQYVRVSEEYHPAVEAACPGYSFELLK